APRHPPRTTLMLSSDGSPLSHDGRRSPLYSVPACLPIATPRGPLRGMQMRSPRKTCRSRIAFVAAAEMAPRTAPPVRPSSPWRPSYAALVGMLFVGLSCPASIQATTTYQLRFKITPPSPEICQEFGSALAVI